MPVHDHLGQRGLAGPRGPLAGPRRRRIGPILAGLLAALLLLTGAAPASSQEKDASPPPTPGEWSRILRSHSDSFLQARAAHRQALRELEADRTEDALAALDRAAALDPRYPLPHLTRARVDLGRGDALAAGELLIGMRDMLSGFRNQARTFSHLLLWVDLVLAGLLLWTVAVLLFRYVPFARHQLAGIVDAPGHLGRRSSWLWIPLLSPLLWGLGIVPLLALLLPALWIYAGRRSRVALALLVGWFALQGVVPGPFGTLLAGVDPGSRVGLALRAAEEPPTPALRAELDAALALAPEDADLRFARGLSLARDGRFERSSADFLACLAIRPEDARSTNNLACNHFFTGDVDRAVAGYQRSAALDSTLATTYYNLSQAYIRKLFLREGGEALRTALRRGFSTTGAQQDLPRGAVYYERPTTAQYWAMAWGDRDALIPADLLIPHARWLGVAPRHAGFWLGVSLLLAGILGTLLPRPKLAFECANCGSLACGRCAGEHEGAVLCAACAGTARRAKSEMVLHTLLRNRRQEAEIRFLRRQRALAGWTFGAVHVYNGLRLRGMISAGILVALLVGAFVPWPLLHDPWELPAQGGWGVQRIVCLVGLALLALISGLGRIPLRARHLHLHPSSLVSLVDLIEGREKRRLRSGGEA